MCSSDLNTPTPQQAAQLHGLALQGLVVVLGLCQSGHRNKSRLFPVASTQRHRHFLRDTSELLGSQHTCQFLGIQWGSSTKSRVEDTSVLKIPKYALRNGKNSSLISASTNLAYSILDRLFCPTPRLQAHRLGQRSLPRRPTPFLAP